MKKGSNVQKNVSHEDLFLQESKRAWKRKKVQTCNTNEMCQLEALALEKEHGIQGFKESWGQTVCLFKQFVC
jgi:hypothetical protein